MLHCGEMMSDYSYIRDGRMGLTAVSRRRVGNVIGVVDIVGGK